MIKELTSRRFFTAAECNAQKEMPLTTLVQRLIEVATEHANAIDIGYSRLCQYGCTWVLSRVTLEIDRMPGVNEYYSLTTWVENVTRLYSERCFEMTDDGGNVMGRARTMWIAINVESRRPADLTMIEGMGQAVNQDRVCNVERCPKPRAVNEPDGEDFYRFRTCDIDFNRHVNSTRYVELILDHWPVDFFDANRVSMFDISYHHEALFGQDATVRCKTDDDGVHHIEIKGDDATFVLATLETVSL